MDNQRAFSWAIAALHELSMNIHNPDSLAECNEAIKSMTNMKALDAFLAGIGEDFRLEIKKLTDQ